MGETLKSKVCTRLMPVKGLASKKLLWLLSSQRRLPNILILYSALFPLWKLHQVCFASTAGVMNWQGQVCCQLIVFDAIMYT